MEFTGSVKQVLEPKTFNKKDGTTGKNQTIVVESVGGKYPTLLAIDLDDKFVDTIEVGYEGVFHCNVSSREWSGKYFTSARLWKWDKVGGATPVQASLPASTFVEESDGSDLPF